MAGDDRTVSISTSATSASAKEHPKTWGPFHLLQRLDAGGFGEVYRAWDLTLEREVALKLLLPRDLNQEEQYTTIVAEARAMARVRHPNTIAVYGVDRHDDRVGLWSDFVRGQTLARWVDSDGPRSEKETIEIGITLCEALSAVHHAGLLHRDIKPGNAMRAEDGRILLMDFGLSHELYQEGRLGGTIGYMAPELLIGGAPSVESDFYAMGVLLLFLCTGKTSPSPDKTTISTGLSQVIETATAVDRGQRYQSAAKLRDALAALNASSSAAVQSKRRLRARTMWLVAAILLLCAVAALVPLVRTEVKARFAGTSRVAYEDYLAADDALLRYDKPGNTQKAIELYQQTLERSPNFALAEAGLARAYWRMYLDTSNKKLVDQAGQSAAQAATMNPTLAPVQVSLGG